MPKNNPTSSNPLGPLHADSIRRVADVPKAADGHFNTTPGNREPVTIIAGDGKKWPKR